MPLSVSALMGPTYTEVQKVTFPEGLYIITNNITVWFNYRCMHVMTYRLPFLGKNNTKNIYVYQNTGRFIMFSVITNIYNKQTKGPTLMELSTTTWKLKFSLTSRDVRCLHHGWQGTHRYYIQVLATHADAFVARTWTLNLNFFNFPVAVENSIKIGPLVFLL
jgi:hypothetical protein